MSEQLTEKQKHCPYCHGKKGLINTLHYDYSHSWDVQLGQCVHIENDSLVVEEATVNNCQINYCPIC